MKANRSEIYSIDVLLNKWGNSLGLRISNKVLKALDINENSKLTMRCVDNKIIIQKKKDLSQMCKAINKDNLNIDREFLDSKVGNEW